MKGGNTILENIYDDSYSISSIYYRENGVININTFKEFDLGDQKGITYSYINLRCDKEGAVQVDNDSSVYGGTYQRAYVTSIATYPEKFPF